MAIVRWGKMVLCNQLLSLWTKQLVHSGNETRWHEDHQLDMVTFAQNSGARNWGISVSLKTTWSTGTFKPDKATQRDSFSKKRGGGGRWKWKKENEQTVKGKRRKEKNPAPGVDEQELYSDSGFLPTLQCVRTKNLSNRNKVSTRSLNLCLL